MPAPSDRPGDEALEEVLSFFLRRFGFERAAIGKLCWLVEAGELQLPQNFFANLDHGIRERILTPRSGQGRIRELFRTIHGQLIPRVAIETIARQKDPMRWVRDARLHLAAEGIEVLGHQGSDPARARELGLPVPKKGEFIAAKRPGRDGG